MNEEIVADSSPASEQLMSTPAKVEPASRPRRRLLRWAVLLLVLAGASWFGGPQLWALYHFRAAQQALQHHDFPEALDHLERCLRVWPNSSSTHFQAARAARRADLLAQAETHLAACENDPGVTEASLERFLLRAQQGNLGEVEQPLQGLLLDGHPDSVLILEALAQGYLRVSSYGPAQGALNDLLQREPEHPWAWFWRGSLHRRVGSIPKALPDYRQAVRLAPHRAAFRLGLALALVQSSRSAEAWPYLEQLLGESASDPDVQLAAAQCLRGLERPAEALPYLDALLRDHPDHAEAWAERGQACADQGDSAEALRCLRRALELEPNSYTIAFALFSELGRQGRAREATAILERVERGMRDEQRLQQLLTQQARQPRDAALACEIGTIFASKNAGAEALRWFSTALQIDPNHRPTHAALADYYQGKGNSEAAALHRRRAGSLP
jgi:tetratricopeptide (TPR) repeat protein